MNKILKNNNQKIIIDNLDVNLELNGEETITIFNTELHNLNLKIKKNAKITVNDFRIIQNSNTEVNIEVAEAGEIIYNHAFVNHESYNLNIKMAFQANNGIAKVNINGINDGGIAKINIDGIIEKTKFNNEFLENINLININAGKGTCIPNILIANSRVIANHQVAIGKINSNELEYLMSKGITKESAQKLILNGFLIKTFKDKDLIIKIKELKI